MSGAASAPWSAEESKALARFGSAIFDVLFEQFCDGAWEVEVNDLITIHALKAGLVEVVEFDPDEHTDNDGACEPGDDYYVITMLGRKARERHRRASLARTKQTGEAK